MTATFPTPRTPNGPADAVARASGAGSEEAYRGVSLGAARRRFESSMVARSPDTLRSYAQALDHFLEFLEGQGITETSETTAIPPEAAERFASWAVRRYGRRPRGTQVTYLAGVRAFYRFLDRHALLPVGVTVERTRLAVREVIGRPGPYRAPRIDPRLPEVVLVADAMPLPEANGAASHRARLELLRDRAILRVLYEIGRAHV